MSGGEEIRGSRRRRRSFRPALAVVLGLTAAVVWAAGVEAATRPGTAFIAIGKGAEAFSLPTAAAVEEDGSALIGVTTVQLPNPGGSRDLSTPVGSGLYRVRNDGSLDQTFGESGRARLPARRSLISSIAIGPDRAVLVAAAVLSRNVERSSTVLFRYHSDGRLDPSFGRGGRVPIFRGLDSVASRVIVSPSGEILVGGTADRGSKGRRGKVKNGSQFFVAKLTPDGRRVKSFGRAGIATTHFARKSFATDLRLERDGRIRQVGAVEAAGAGSRAVLASYRRNGRADKQLGPAGRRFLPNVVWRATGSKRGAVVARSSDLRLDRKGGVVAFGELRSKDGRRGTSRHYLARYRRNGGLDSSFGRSGVVYPKQRADLTFATFLPLRSGAIATSLPIKTIGGSRFAVEIRKPSGGVRFGFGSRGLAHARIGTENIPMGMVEGPAGTILLFTATTNRKQVGIGLARYREDTGLDRSFGGK